MDLFIIRKKYIKKLQTKQKAFPGANILVLGQKVMYLLIEQQKNKIKSYKQNKKPSEAQIYLWGKK